MSFFDSINYKENALKTKASACITNSNLEKYLPSSTEKIIVKHVLFDLAKSIKILYPDADIDYNDKSLKPVNTKNFKNVVFGNNVLVGKNVEIGKNTQIGSNSIIEHDVKIGKI